MSESDGNGSSSQQIKDAVLKGLKSTLNQHRKTAEEDDGAAPDAPAAKQVSALDEERQRLVNQDFKAETTLKKNYGYCLLAILAVQLIAMNVIFILDGAFVLHFSDVTLQIFMGGTLTEVFGLVLIVTKYLFKKK